MAKMEDDVLRALIEHQERQSIGYYTTQIAADQKKALDYYLSHPLGNEEEGRSQVISSDVRDIVEGLTPQVLKPFVASDDVVKFNPLGPDDEEQAQQESDYINWVVTQKNDVFNQLIAAVKSGLTQKNAVAKYWWEKTRKTTIERYFGISDDEFALLSQDDGVEITEHTESQDSHGEPVHDVTVRAHDDTGQAKYAVLPPEEFLVSRDATTPNPKEARFVQHRQRVTLSDLREMGFDVEDDLTDGGEDPNYSLQYQARHWDESLGTRNDEMLDPASREVLLRETYIRADRDGDGIAELLKVFTVGRELLSVEETEEIPFVGWTPSPQPFKFYGRCPADDGIEFQDIKTTLLRQNLDNIYTVNNNRVYVSSKVNMDDLVDNQIAGIVRIDGDEATGHVQAAEITPLGAVIQPTIEWLDSAKENRTGLTRYNQGTDSDSLNKTATGIRIIAQNSSARVDLISRAFAEQFLAPLCVGIHGLCRRHGTKAETVRLRGNWVSIDPRQWKTRMDMSVAVGLGNADQQMKMQGAQMLLQQQLTVMQTPAGQMIQPQNLYASLSKLAEAIGYKQPEQFFTAPEHIPQQQPAPPPPEIMVKHQELDLKSRELDQKDKAYDLEERKVAVMEHDSLVKADASEATVALQAAAQGFDSSKQILDSLESLQQLMHSMQLGQAQHDLAAQAQTHSQIMAEQGAQRDAQAQVHAQGLAESSQALQAQGQAHSQEMAEQAAKESNGPAGASD